jgi:sec-independent protein translocase protein TatB
MFEVGFSELLMIGLVALLVIGPERLPKAARIAGLWMSKARRTIANVKAEIKHELHAEEMRQLLQQQALSNALQQAVEETETVVADIQHSLKSSEESLQNDDRTV